jgi:hypothetical protein
MNMFEMLHRTSGFDRFFRLTLIVEKCVQDFGLECQDSLYRFTEYSSKNTTKISMLHLMEVKDATWKKDTILFLCGTKNADHHSGTVSK